MPQGKDKIDWRNFVNDCTDFMISGHSKLKYTYGSQWKPIAMQIHCQVYMENLTIDFKWISSLY